MTTITKFRIQKLQWQISCAQCHLVNLRDLIQKVGAGNYPSASTDALLRLILSIVEELEHEFTRLSKQLTEPVDSVDVLSLRILGLARASTELAPFVRYAEDSSVDIVPWGVSSYLRRLCLSFDIPIQIIIRPRFTFSYEQLDINASLFETVGVMKDLEPLLNTQPYFVVLSFPRTERLNLLQHAVWGHEIAHSLDFILGQTSVRRLGKSNPSLFPLEWTLSNHLASEMQPSEDILSSLALSIYAGPDSGVDAVWPKDQSLLTDQQSATLRVALMAAMDWLYPPLRCWVAEFVCDLLAVRLFGPAALLAFSEVNDLLYPLFEPYMRHPPAAMRQHLMLRELDELGYFELADESDWSVLWGPLGLIIKKEMLRIARLSRFWDPIESLHNEYLNNFSGDFKEKKTIDAVLKILANNEKGLEVVYKFIVELEKPYFVKPDKLIPEALMLISYLEKAIPPNTLGLTEDVEPATLPGILNAGWVRWLAVMHSGSANEHGDAREFPQKELVAQRELINRLVLKAIESSEIQHQYAERKRVFGD